MEIAFRPALEQDYEACRRLYFSQMEKTIRELDLDPVAHAAGFREQWIPSQVRIIQFGGQDVGWLQVIDRSEGLLLAQIFVESQYQNQGIGTHVMRRVIEQAAEKCLPLALAVVKNNRALRLYQRLGFRVVQEDGCKFYMRLDLSEAGGIS